MRRKNDPPDKTQTLTKLDKEHARRGNRSLAIGGYTLEIAGVCSVQVSDTEARAVKRGSVGDPPRLLHHRGVVLQPTHDGRRVARHAAEKLSRVAQRGGDVVHGSFQADEERPWKTPNGMKSGRRKDKEMEPKGRIGEG